MVDTNPSSSSYNMVVATIDLGPLISNATSGAAVTPDGALVYLATTNFGGIGSSQGGIYVTATATNTVVGSFSLAAGTQPTAVTITPAAANRNICPESQGFWKDHGRL